MRPRLRAAAWSALAAMVAANAACVRRTVSITSEPSGALVLLNDREIGRTPVTAEILYYGEYDLQLRLEGHAPLDTSATAKAPPWDWIGPDLVAELLPIDLVSRNEWHFTLVPRNDDPDAVLERAKVLRLELLGEEASRRRSGEDRLENLQREIEAADAVPPAAPPTP